MADMGAGVGKTVPLSVGGCQLLFVGAFCGCFLWVLFVGAFCGCFLWVLFVGIGPPPVTWPTPVLASYDIVEITPLSHCTRPMQDACFG
jgi:hypothetical protein